MDLQRSNISLNTRQDFLKIPGILAAALETQRICFSKVILESNVSTVTSIVNGSDWGWIVLGMETTMVLVLVAFSFIRKRSHNVLTSLRSRFMGLCNCNSKAWRWHNSYQNGIIGITDKLVHQHWKWLRVVQVKQYRSKNTSNRNS